MHLLTTSSASLDDLAEPVDLRQSPADIMALSFADSDLAGLASAWKMDAAVLPSIRLARLADLRHPMSVDLWLDGAGSRAKVILVRILGGYDWWRYGCDRLAAVARERGIQLALLPGECRERDARLEAASTVPQAELAALLDFFREGGPQNMRALLARLAGLAGGATAATIKPVRVPRFGFYEPGVGVGAEIAEMPEVRHSPLSCRTSPPRRGRLAVALSRGIPDVSGDAGRSEQLISPRQSERRGTAEAGPDDRSLARPEAAEKNGSIADAESHSAQTNAFGGSASADLQAAAPAIPVLFYRSMLLAADVAPIDALCQALAARGLRPVPIFVPSLKDPAALAFVEQALAGLDPAAIVTATAFAAGSEPGTESIFDRTGCPVFQVVVATTRRTAWRDSPRGLAPADLAMHVVMPELDGRILAGAISFKAENEVDPALGFSALGNLPEADRVDQVAERIAAMVRLQQTPAAERRLAILMPDYPGAPGRTGYAVGLDVPASVLAILHDLNNAGYQVDGIPESPRELLDLLESGCPGMALDDYAAAFGEMPASARQSVEAGWGAPRPISPRVEQKLPYGSGHRAARGQAPATGRGAVPPDSPKTALGEKMLPRDPHPTLPPSGLPAISSSRGGITPSIPFRAATFGNITVALAPDRGRSADRRADYHDPALPPRHELIAFGFWLRQMLGCHALVHVGAHGTLEWLPGKTVALSSSCFPEIVAGPLPVAYPFIVSNPGEAAQAKRRIAAVTIGHLPPPLHSAGLDPDSQELERLVDEYAQADGLDRRRRDRLAGLIVDKAGTSGLAAEAGVATTDAPDEALRRIDAWLCDLKDFAIKDGLHVFGRAPEGEADPLRLASAAAERDALLAALAGRHVSAGPSGAPSRGRVDILPTGRNLYTTDPRTMPTPTAYDLGKAAAEEVLRAYLQTHGDWPRSLVIDLWGSASLRTGGEEIAQGLALMGCRPRWDAATGRVTGIEVLPPAMLGRPRVDVTFRISGLFRDMFPTQIALLDAACAAVAARDEAAEENPLAEAARAAGAAPARLFGSSPGTYGAGPEDLLASGDWQTRDELGRAYLESASHAYGGAEGTASAAPGAFGERIASADLLVHSGDDPGRDVLEGSADVAFIGGFSAAVAMLGGHAEVIVLDITDPARPRPRSVTQAVSRAVRARAVNPRFIAGQMRHGPRGASEFAETVDRLIGFAETTEAIPPALIEAVYDAYIGDPPVRAFLLRENRAAAAAIAERFLSARRRGLWHPLRNSIDDDLAALIAEAHQPARVLPADAGVAAKAAECSVAEAAE